MRSIHMGCSLIHLTDSLFWPVFRAARRLCRGITVPLVPGAIRLIGTSGTAFHPHSLELSQIGSSQRLVAAHHADAGYNIARQSAKDNH
ncbi:hypothetical protein [Polaromonas jejuensis]|uniref:Uncharacterized protein n=1 Tax=Polaromonas jejuensis TaxID=457502 RepID=A0ABW0Q947_9BURK|nr:hypothetical protein [Polaromonas jejuensis]